MRSLTASWAGLGIAALLLIGLEVTVSSSNATGLLALADWPGRLVASWMDPSVPLVPYVKQSTGPSAAALAAASSPGPATSPSNLAIGHYGIT